MKKEDVPQDEGLYGRWHGISYAVDEDGKYALIRSAGWEPANWANRQAWDVVEQEIAGIVEKIGEGRVSPLAYYMARNLMDVKLLSRHAGLAQWRVKRHLRPGVFRRLSPTILERYAKIFKISVEQLKETPQ
jgi:hypothetical protein